ncbi:MULTISPECIES: Lrp/AsnC family transcriptional regulator [Metallosphaera]|uniref:Transcriptional regulator, AsnC family n=3 Tax=Metallosphaera TaxID=41980 RepID=A4YG18_METS5|nr:MULTISPECIES: Lrp/AsnC family transcriptional regulator [Metallosphaera]ABP95370.1 transcriptional regulator, AsnC family [Metallosphaera sedula DSM 5348]AIM27356.1 transcriptional regulator, AsnC family [Metallosphaera sedula]AKV74237.1 AsnC family transcriptional regulator [Metallosphaera sedula]AKV76476.1 AsnC family transcriptional regulator [Metallosphaera sedula]AKV78728.1 AsnC family transcriptional regulator [Metallosphaera sedula]
MPSYRLDHVDMRILDKLRSNARFTFSDLSKELDIPASTLRYRIRKLEDNKVILGYYPLIDGINLGFKVSMILIIDSVPKYIESVVKEILQFPSVIRIYGVDSGPRLHVHALFREEEEAYAFISERLYKIEGITSVETSKVIKRYKTDPSFSL